MRLTIGSRGGLDGRLWRKLTIGFLVGAALATGCGPSQEEIMAREQARVERETRQRQLAEEARRQAEEARRQAEEAKRKAEEARRERIRATMAAGDEAARMGQSETALNRYREALGDVERYSDQDRQLRQEIITSVRKMAPPPPIPGEALRYMARGEAKVKMGGPGSFKAAAEEMEQAALAAPWVADAYFNLGIVQEKAEMYRQSIRNLRLYLFAAPQSPNANAIQAKIYGLEVLQEEQEKTRSLAGSWRSKGGNTYNVTVQGKKIGIDGSMTAALTDGSKQKWWYVLDLEKKGSALEGTVAISREGNHGCYFPNETVPASGEIRPDGNSMKIDWKESMYTWTWQGSVCTGVSSLGKQGSFLELVERIGNTVAPAVVESPSPPVEEKKPMKKRKK
jgi:tetratricopeptide (TPR) repeat protein